MYTAFNSKLDDVTEQNNPFYSDSLQALFDSIRLSPTLNADTFQDVPQPPPPTPVVPVHDKSETLTHLDDILSCWLNSAKVQRLEGSYSSDVLVKKDIHPILSRRLRDDLLTEQDYNNLAYTSNLFIRLHDLIGMYNPVLHKREVIEVLIKHYDMRRISECVFTKICIKL